MGVYYHYANFTKRQRFAVDAVGGSVRHHAVGRTPAGRAFHLLLMGQPGHDVPAEPGGRGYWAGDSVAVVGDDLLDDWEQFESGFTDIEADVIVLLFEADGFDAIGEAAERHTPLFMQLCYLVATRQVLALEPHMRQRFGARYLKRYEELSREHPSHRPKDLTVRLRS